MADCQRDGVLGANEYCGEVAMPYVGWESKLRESKNPGDLLRVSRIMSYSFIVIKRIVLIRSAIG